MAIRHILTSLALFAGIICSQALAQQSGSTRQPGIVQQPGPEPARQQWRVQPPAQPWQVAAQRQEPGQVQPVSYQAPVEQQPVKQQEAAQQEAVQPAPQTLDPQPGSPILVQPKDQSLEQSLLEEDSVYQPLDQSVGPCCDQCGGGAYCPPDWYVDQGVRIWHRCRPHRSNLASSFTSSFFISEVTGQNQWRVTPITPTVSLFTTKSFGFDVAAGYNITLGHYLGRDTQNRDHFVEFGYFGMNEWEVGRTLSGVTEPIYVEETWNQAQYDEYLAGTRVPRVLEYVGSLRSSFPTVTFDGINFTFPNGAMATESDAVISRAFNQVQEYAVAYRSTLNSFEINGRIKDRGRTDRLVLHPNGKWKRECQKGWFMSYLFGMRVITVDEAFGLYTSGSHYGAIPVVDGGGNIVGYTPTLNPIYTTSGSVLVETHNRLVGLQIGGDLIYRKCLWEWGFKAKIGPMMNFADQTSRVVARQTQAGLAPVATVNHRATVDGAAAFADIGVVGSYKILPNMTFHASWDWMWITGLALAPEQISPYRTSVPRVNDNGFLFFQGLTLNLECNW